MKRDGTKLTFRGSSLGYQNQFKTLWVILLTVNQTNGLSLLEIRTIISGTSLLFLSSSRETSQSANAFPLEQTRKLTVCLPLAGSKRETLTFLVFAVRRRKVSSCPLTLNRSRAIWWLSCEWSQSSLFVFPSAFRTKVLHCLHPTGNCGAAYKHVDRQEEHMLTNLLAFRNNFKNSSVVGSFVIFSVFLLLVKPLSYTYSSLQS